MTMPQSLDSTASDPANTPVRTTYLTRAENRPSPRGRSLLIIQASTTIKASLAISPGWKPGKWGMGRNTQLLLPVPLS